MTQPFAIRTESQLSALLGEPAEYVKGKVRSRLDAVMQEFIRRSPLVFVATMDAQGQVDISPKGDPCGFVHLDAKGHLLIPERPGNKLTFGLRNLLRNSQIGLLFVVPQQREVLRVKGVATLHNDPSVLAQLQVQGKPALLCTEVEVQQCFMHCGRALVRSKLWQPAAWDGATDSLGAKHFATLSGAADAEALADVAAQLEHAYTTDLY